MKRRTFLAATGLGAGGLLALAAERRWRRGVGFLPTRPDHAPRALSPAEWRTLEAAQDRLLPSGGSPLSEQTPGSLEGSPGARDINAIGYLDGALAELDTDPADRDRVRKGAARIDELARARGAPSFAALDEAKRDQALREFQKEDDAGAWFEVMLGFTLEALLGDPVHGGNPDEIGWRWLGHQPGWPRPSRSAT